MKEQHDSIWNLAKGFVPTSLEFGAWVCLGTALDCAGIMADHGSHAHAPCRPYGGDRPRRSHIRHQRPNGKRSGSTSTVGNLRSRNEYLGHGYTADGGALRRGGGGGGTAATFKI